MASEPSRGGSTSANGPTGSSPTTSSPLVPDIDLRVVEGDVRPIHAEAAAELGDRSLWLVGGGELVGQFYDAGLLDVLIIEFTPVTLGTGAPLLPRRITSKNLAFRDANLIGQRLMVTLDVTRDEPR